MKNKDLPWRLNEWVDETINVDTLAPEMDESGKMRLQKKTIPVKQKTMFVDPKPRTVRCASGKHSFYCIDKQRYIFACKNCEYKRQVYPVTYDYDGKNLIHKKTGKMV